MISLLDVEPYNRKYLKFTAIFDIDGCTKKINFGNSRSKSYIENCDKFKRTKYHKRHTKDLISNDPMNAGILSYYLMWGESSNLDNNIKYFKKAFNI